MFSIKESLIVAALKPFLNGYLEDIGVIRELNIDTGSKQVSISVELKGEESPVDIDIKRYEIIEQDGKSFLIVKEVSFSREWINRAVDKWKPEMKFPIPGIAKGFL